MKGQSAIEFISVYGFMLIIAALFIVLVILFAFSAQGAIQTSKCNGFTGFYCTSAQVVSNTVSKNSIIFLALDSEQSVPINVIGVNFIVGNSIYSGRCTPSLATPTVHITCTAAMSGFTRQGIQVIGSYIVNAQYCNSPLYNVSIKDCAYDNVTYNGEFSTYASDHLSLGFENNSVAPQIVGVINGLNLPEGIAVSPSGTRAYVAEPYSSFYGEIAVISIPANSVSGSFTSGLANPSGVAVGTSGSYVYATNLNFFGATKYIEVVNTATGSGTTQVDMSDQEAAIAMVPSGAYAYASGYSNQVEILNTGTNSITGTVNIGYFAYYPGIAISPGGKYAYITNNNGNNVLILNTATGTVSGAITSPSILSPEGDAISPDGKYLYIANAGDENLIIVDIATGKIVNSVSAGFNGPYGVAFSPTGSLVYVTNQYGGNVVIINPGSYN